VANDVFRRIVVKARGPAPRPAQRLGLIAAGLVLGALLAEGGVRAYAAVDRGLGTHLAETDPLAILVEPHGTIGYRQKPNMRFRYANGTAATSNGMGFRGPEVTETKPSGVTRIVLLGGSTTHGWGVEDDQTIDAHMRRLFAQRAPSRRFEVVNLAFDAYDSNQLVERLVSDGTRLDPDFLIVNSGINDVANARLPDLQEHDPRTLGWQATLERVRAEQARGRPYLRTLAKHHSYLVRLVSLFRRRTQIARVEETHRTVVPHPQAAEHFQRNLHRIGQIAADHAMTLMLSTPPSALRDNFAPAAHSTLSYWLADAAATQDYRDTLAVRMHQVAVDLAARGQAARYFRPVVPPSEYLDDCHLTSEGNRVLAEVFVDAIVRHLDSATVVTERRPHARD
jgi:lysophospholipase L1-like esterase